MEIDKIIIHNNNLINILDNYDKKIGGFDFDFGYDEDEYFNSFFPKTILNKLNRHFENLEYIKISSKFISILINKQMYSLFKNKFKEIEIIPYCFKDYKDDYNMLTSIFKNLKNNLKPEVLKIIYDDTEKYEYDYFSSEVPDQNNIFSLTNMNSIKQLKLEKIYNYVQFDSGISKNLNNLYIDHTYIDYIGVNINFSNLKTLEITDTHLVGIFNPKFVNFDSFINLESLSVTILGTCDFIILSKIIKSSANKLIKFSIYSDSDLTYNIDEDYLNNYFEKINDKKENFEEEDEIEIKKEEEEEEEDNDIEIDSKNDLDEIVKKFGHIMLELKNLKYLEIYYFNFDYTPFIKIILLNYENKNLISFKTDYVIKSSLINQFLKRNPNIKNLEFTKKK